MKRLVDCLHCQQVPFEKVCGTPLSLEALNILREHQVLVGIVNRYIALRYDLKDVRGAKRVVSKPKGVVLSRRLDNADFMTAGTIQKVRSYLNHGVVGRSVLGFLLLLGELRHAAFIILVFYFFYHCVGLLLLLKQLLLFKDERVRIKALLDVVHLGMELIPEAHRISRGLDLLLHGQRILRTRWKRLIPHSSNFGSEIHLDHGFKVARLVIAPLRNDL